MFVWLNSSVLLDKVNSFMHEFMANEIASEDGRSLPPMNPERYEGARLAAEKSVKNLLDHLVGAKVKGDC